MGTQSLVSRATGAWLLLSLGVAAAAVDWPPSDELRQGIALVKEGRYDEAVAAFRAARGKLAGVALVARVADGSAVVQAGVGADLVADLRARAMLKRTADDLGQLADLTGRPDASPDEKALAEAAGVYSRRAAIMLQAGVWRKQLLQLRDVLDSTVARDKKQRARPGAAPSPADVAKESLALTEVACAKMRELANAGGRQRHTIDPNAGHETKIAREGVDIRGAGGKWVTESTACAVAVTPFGATGKGGGGSVVLPADWQKTLSGLSRSEYERRYTRMVEESCARALAKAKQRVADATQEVGSREAAQRKVTAMAGRTAEQGEQLVAEAQAALFGMVLAGSYTSEALTPWGDRVLGLILKTQRELDRLLPPDSR